MPKVVTHNGQLVTLGGKALEVDATDTPPITVDSALSSTSENPVQNKVVTAALAGKITAPTTAAVGQIIKVKSVDTSGKPTEWEAADLPSGGESILLLDKKITVEEASTVTENIGRADTAKKYLLHLTFSKNTADAWGATKNIDVCINGSTIGYFAMQVNLDSSKYEFYAEAEYDAITRIAIMGAVNSLKYNITPVKRQLNLGAQNNNGKIEIKFASPYSGIINVKLYGEY